MELAVTIGDANGISLETFVKAISENLNLDEIKYNNFTLFGNRKVINQYICQLNLPAKICDCDNTLIIKSKAVKIYDLSYSFDLKLGELSAEAGKLAIMAINEATKKTLAGEFDAIVTLPVNKKAINETEVGFIGHTEHIAKMCNVKNPIMILFHENLRVVLATTHIPLYLVSRRVTKKRLSSLIYHLNRSLRKDFAIEKPNMAVLGMNPHSGENGLMGKEELQVIAPALEVMKRKGINVSGTFAADGFFAHGSYEKFDAVVAMYHDQGLIPLKLIANGSGVNFTANLPIVRTSPDHGTAFDMVGKSNVSAKSTLAAIIAAIKIAQNRQRK